MAHNIFGKRFFERGEDLSAWHRIGNNFTGKKTLEEAVVESGLDYRVWKEPLVIYVDGRAWETGHYAIVREALADDCDDNGECPPRIFNTVGDEFTDISNIDLARALEPLNAEWPIETMGALGKGETIFFTLKVGGGAVHGDEIVEYFLVSNGRDARRALRIDFTPVRVVCQNTLNSGYSAATVTVKMTHKTTIASDLAFWSSILPQMRVAREKTRQAFDALAATRVSDDQARQVIAAAYPEPKASAKVKLADDLVVLDLRDETIVKVITDANDAHAAVNARVDAFREAAFDRYNVFNDEFPKVAGTAWAAWQAVTETSDWRQGKAKGGSARATDESVIFGARAKEKERGFAAAMDLVIANN
jgi:phage/plasmid-like protein (TIGR03299 family)